MTPFAAPLLIPTIMAVGVASPSAQGQATTSIATAGIIADSAPAAKYHAPKVPSAGAITAVREIACYFIDELLHRRLFPCGLFNQFHDLG